MRSRAMVGITASSVPTRTGKKQPLFQFGIDHVDDTREVGHLGNLLGLKLDIERVFEFRSHGEVAQRVPSLTVFL